MSTDGQPAVRQRSGTEGTRADLHNPSVDEQAAEAGMRGNVHLPSGRICVLSSRHSGPGRFVPRSQPSSPGN